MPATHRRADQSVIERLLDEPQQFEFVQAVRIALCWLAEQGVPPERALREHLRFQNSLSLAFAPGEVEALVAAGDVVLEHEQAMADALARQALRIRITPSFMGMLGAAGTLPAHYTERIAAWQLREHDEAPRAFLDLFSGRMLALFYEAWRKYRVEQAMADGEDGFQPLLLALAGFEPGTALTNSHGVCDRMIALFAGSLQQRPVPSPVLNRMLASYLGVGVAVEEAVGHWNRMAPHEQTSLNGEHATLGDDTILGETSWRPDLRVRLRIGPLDRRQFDLFLPHGEGAATLRRMLNLFSNPALVYEVRLVLRAGEVRPSHLAGGAGEGARLGRDSFLVSSQGKQDRTDMRYELRPMAPLAPRRAKPRAHSSSC
jgi:type VI secretion system protein ImpH